jgi:hypothetical protein
MSVKEVEELKHRGAQYVVVLGVPILRARQPDVLAYLERSFRAVSIRPGLVVWDLTVPATSPPPGVPTRVQPTE